MKRGALFALTATVFLAAVLAWTTVRQEREFRRLIAAGDEALTNDLTFEAIEAFSGALALKDDSMLAHLKRGDSYRRRGELAAALRDLRDAVALDPTATRPLELLGDVNAAMGRQERAVELYRQFIALDDRAPRVLYKLALAYYRRGQTNLAVDPLRRAVVMDPRMAEAHYLLGVCLRERLRTAEAVRELQRAIEISPAFAAAREELGDLYGSLGRNRERVEQLEALASLEPTSAHRLVSVGSVYARSGRSDAALAALARAAERHPDDPAAFTAMGRILLQTAELRNDTVALGKAIGALEPRAAAAGATSETLALFGRAQFLSGNVEAAERTLQTATERLPVETAAFVYLSAAAERLGHVTVARDALVRYVSLLDDPEQSRTLAAQIAALSLKMNDARSAEAWAQRAVDADNPDAYVLGLLADAELRLGQVPAARLTLAEALAHDPGNAALLRLQRRLGK